MSLLDYIQDAKDTDAGHAVPSDITGDSEPKSDGPNGCRRPSRLWYVLHVPFGFMSGPACHVLWEDANQPEAEKHLLHGIMLSAGTWLAAGTALLISFA